MIRSQARSADDDEATPHLRDSIPSSKLKLKLSAYKVELPAFTLTLTF